MNSNSQTKVGFIHNIFLISNIFNTGYFIFETIIIALFLLQQKLSITDDVYSWAGAVQTRHGNYSSVWFVFVVNFIMILVFIKMLFESVRLRARFVNKMTMFEDKSEVTYYAYFSISLLISILVVKSLGVIMNRGFME